MNTESAPGAKTILVIDDNRIILQVMSLSLGKKGYRVLTAETGAQTITVLHKDKPDLILLDLDFPIDQANISGPFRDGFIILDWARLMCDAKKIPVIIISSLDPKEYKVRAQSAGILTILPKPVDNKKLLEAITSALGDAPSAAAN